MVIVGPPEATPPGSGGAGALFGFLHTGKRSVIAEAGEHAVHLDAALVAAADVVVVDAAPRTACGRPGPGPPRSHCGLALPFRAGGALVRAGGQRPDPPGPEQLDRRPRRAAREPGQRRRRLIEWASGAAAAVATPSRCAVARPHRARRADHLADARGGHHHLQRLPGRLGPAGAGRASSVPGGRGRLPSSRHRTVGSDSPRSPPTSSPVSQP